MNLHTTIALLDIYLRKKWAQRSHKNLYMRVYTSFFHNSQTLETTQMPFAGCIFKRTVLHPHYGPLPGDKKKQNIDAHNNLDELPGNYVEWKKYFQKII